MTPNLTVRDVNKEKFMHITKQYEERPMKNQIYTQSSRKLLKYYSILLFPLITSCSLSASAEAKMEPTAQTAESEEAMPASKDADFTQIQQSLQQINKNIQQSSSQGSTPLSFTEKTSTENASTQKSQNISGQLNSNLETNDTKMNMGKGMSRRGKMMMDQGMSKRDKMMMGKGMSKRGKIMMENESMMGSKPKPELQSITGDLGKSLPGYKAVPHLYHLGENDFFLNYQDLIDLSSDQVTELTMIKHQWSKIQNEKLSERKQLEQDLWQLTSLGVPDFSQIQKNISQIESINSAIRLSFIETVGRAVKTLHPKQALLLKEIDTTQDIN